MVIDLTVQSFITRDLIIREAWCLSAPSVFISRWKQTNLFLLWSPLTYTLPVLILGDSRSLPKGALSRSHLHTALPSKILACMTCIYTPRRMTIGAEWFWLGSFWGLFSSNRPKLCCWWSKTLAEHPRLILGVEVNGAFGVVMCPGCFTWMNDWV